MILKFPYRAKVKFIPKEYDFYPFKKDDIICVLGELDSMQEHYVIVLPDGRTVFGYHDDFFEPLDVPEDML